MWSSGTVLDLEESSRTKTRGLGLGLEHSVLEHIPEFIAEPLTKTKADW